jgi:hypothetical protein
MSQPKVPIETFSYHEMFMLNLGDGTTYKNGV